MKVPRKWRTLEPPPHPLPLRLPPSSRLYIPAVSVKSVRCRTGQNFSGTVLLSMSLSPS